jgi:hypothetical protein
MGCLTGIEGVGCGLATGAGFRAAGLALVSVGAAALGLTGAGAGFAATTFPFALTGAGTAFAGAADTFTLAAAVLAAAAVTGFAGDMDFVEGFLALLDTGLLAGFLAAVATIDSSVGDTALEKLAADCATAARCARNHQTG